MARGSLHKLLRPKSVYDFLGLGIVSLFDDVFFWSSGPAA